MADNYIVNYDINVRSEDAVTALKNFQTAINNLTELGTKLNNFQKKLNGITTKIPKMDISTRGINMKLDRVIAKLERIHTLAKTAPVVNSKGQVVQAPPAPAQQQNANPTTRNSSRRTYSTRTSNRPSGNLSYKLLGPTPLNVGGVIGLDFLKGMGIAYGIGGAGTLVRNIISEATEYNNLMQTAKNILKTHDKDSNFGGRFSQMEQIVRNVGVETKFTAPQVADAAKFLAMAGFDINAINQSIRPIADIALIGDTELGETADVVTNIMTGYGISPDQVRKATDIMTMTFTKSNTTLLEIAEAYKYSASLLSAAGIEFEESTAAIGILGDAGIKGSQAGTTMRTIMANIVNPTKKQLAQWEKIGVSRMDKNGQVRSLVDIFEDLADAGLYVDDFYKLFHKTAAQGAVSLANNVEKWNEIIADNFLSDGLAKQLADEKKNTIQGLWAQLTSAFTDTGMKAFESIQNPIKDFMKTMTEWLLKDSTIDKFKEVARDLLDLGQGLKEITKTFLKWAGEWKNVIKGFIKLQIKLMPVLAVFKILKSGWFVFEGIGKTIVKINALSLAFNGLGASMKSIKTIGRDVKVLLATLMTGHSAINPQVATRYLRRFGLSVGKNLGTGSVIASGAFAGNQLSKALGVESETGKLLSTLLGGGVGVVASLFGGPIGWIAGATLALTGLVSYFINVKKKSDAARESFKKFANTTRMINGVFTGEEGLSKTERYLEIVYNKQLSINEVISKRVKLMREELGLQDAGKARYGDNIDGGMMRKIIDDISDVQQRKLISTLKTYTNKNTVIPRISEQGKWRDMHAFEITRTKDQLAAMTALYAEGYEGNAAKSAKDEFQHKLAKILRTGGTYKDIQVVLGEWNKLYGKQWVLNSNKNTRPDQFNYTVEDISKWDGHKISEAYTYRQGVYDSMVGVFGENSPVSFAAQKYFNALKSNNISEAIVLDYIKYMDPIAGMALTLYNPQDLQAWEKSFSFYNNTFNANEATNSTALEEAQRTSKELGNLISVYPQLHTPAQDAVASLMEFAKSLKADADKFIKTSQDTPTKTLNDTDLPDITPDPSDYSTDYKSTSAAPKQIIVKIENLMNVESIDMTNPDNVAVVTDIKEQLAQALVDVVSDFTNNLGN